MHIAHALLTTDTWGGIWTFTRELSQQLRRGDCQVSLASFGPPPAEEEMRSLREWGIAVHCLPWRLEWMQDAERDAAQAQQQLAQLVARLRPDILHCNHYAFARASYACPTVLTAHSDVLSWWRNVRGEAAPATEFHGWYRKLVAEALQNAGLITAPTQSVVRDLRRSFGSFRPVVVIANGRDAANFNPHAPKKNLAVAMGRVWDDAKQLVWLAQSPWPMPVAIAGPWRHPEFKREPPAGAVENRWLGELSPPQTRELLAEALVFIGCSRYEPFGLSALEAALSGCALLLADIDSQREIWQDAAWYFPPPPDPRSRGALAALLLHLQDAPENALQLARRAARRACQLYSSGRMTEEYLRVYAQLLSRPARPPLPAVAEAPCA